MSPNFCSLVVWWLIHGSTMNVGNELVFSMGLFLKKKEKKRRFSLLACVLCCLHIFIIIIFMTNIFLVSSIGTPWCFFLQKRPNFKSPHLQTIIKNKNNNCIYDIYMVWSLELISTSVIIAFSPFICKFYVQVWPRIGYMKYQVNHNFSSLIIFLLISM